MSKKYSLAELVAGLEATIQGDAECLIEGVCTIQEAKPNHIAFLMNPLYKKYLSTTQAAAVILRSEDAKSCNTNAIVCSDPYFTYAAIAQFFDNKPLQQPGIHPSVVIGEQCEIDPTVSIGANCVINNNVKIKSGAIIAPCCVIGSRSEIHENARLDANVTIYHDVIVGKRVAIASGSVLGSDGFGIAKHKGSWHKVPQLGRVIIEDDVEIGANCTIDRGAIENTVIEEGAKLDNLIQIGHNVRIGKNTAVAGCVGISGSTTIGSNCLVGGQAGFAGHITVADNVVITGGTAVTKSIKTPGIYSSGIGGLVSNLEWRKNSARIQRFEQLLKRVKLLEQSIKELTESKEK